MYGHRDKPTSVDRTVDSATQRAANAVDQSKFNSSQLSMTSYDFSIAQASAALIALTGTLGIFTTALAIFHVPLPIIAAVGGFGSVGLALVALKVIARIERRIRMREIEIKLENDALVGLKVTSQNTQLLAAMSHQIRSPLGAIVGLAEIIGRESREKNLDNYVETLVSSSAHLQNVIDGFIDLSQPVNQSSTLKLTNARIGDLIQNRIDLLTVIAQRSQTRVHCNTTAIADQSFAIDETKFSQALLNVVGNAIKFSKDGEVDVRAFLIEDNVDHVVLRVEVRDAGIAFTDRDGNPQPVGSGLGLAISERIVKSMNGKMTIKSLPGEGSTTTLQLPLKRAIEAQQNSTAEFEVSGVENANEASEAPVALPERFENLNGVRVLVAEDNSTNQLVITSILRYLKVPYSVVTDGEAAVSAVQTGEFQLVLMDCQMPLTDGYEATRKIRAHESQVSGKRIPIIALTSSALPDEKEHCLRAGMDHYTTKPISSENLKKLLVQALAKAS